jgi:hypothetical protein
LVDRAKLAVIALPLPDSLSAKMSQIIWAWSSKPLLVVGVNISHFDRKIKPFLAPRVKIRAFSLFSAALDRPHAPRYKQACVSREKWWW